MNIKEQFEKEWQKLSVLKDPIQKETAELWFRLGAMGQMVKISKEILSIQERINKELES